MSSLWLLDGGRGGRKVEIRTVFWLTRKCNLEYLMKNKKYLPTTTWHEWNVVVVDVEDLYVARKLKYQIFLESYCNCHCYSVVWSMLPSVRWPTHDSSVGDVAKMWFVLSEVLFLLSGMLLLTVTNSALLLMFSCIFCIFALNSMVGLLTSLKNRRCNSSCQSNPIICPFLRYLPACERKYVDKFHTFWQHFVTMTTIHLCWMASHRR